MLQSAKNLVKFVEKVKPNADAIISMGIRSDGEIEAFFYLHKGNGREVFAKLITCPTLLLAPRDTDKYIDLEGIYEGYKLRVTFLNERDDVVQIERHDEKAGYPEIAKDSIFWNYMTPNEWDSFIQNLDKAHYVKAKRYIELHKDGTFRDFIGAGFAWSDTEEGAGYWIEISKRKSPIV
jgi:hypothetical protein